MRTLSLLLVALLAGCEQTAHSQQAAPPPLAVEAPPADGEILSSRRTAITRAVEAASPAVVSVNVIEVQNVRVRDPFAGFFGRRVPDRVYQQQVQGVGSGFIVSPDGYIVTNDHVAGNATKITVAFPDGSQLPAELVGSDPQTDIALLKVDPPAALPYLSYEEAGDAIVGEWVVALGNPFGLFEAAEPTVTVGVVSAIGRDFPAQDGRTFRDLVQTDAAINSGNSGGPLVNALGHVIGMNTFIFSRSGGSVGIGFAVPSWRIRQVVAELRTSGSVDRSFYTGLSVNAVTPQIARALGLDDVRGLIVRSVEPGSPAEAAGLRPYDVVRSVGGEPIASNEDIRQRLVDLRAGDVVRLGVVRDGRPLDVSLRLGRAE
ncbi:trypsin-like peptidase domain-containing protein [Rubrivirga sp. S365]|uniref:Trypsin-like peptidase domain-containing protein n=1 Tax=Rubrivirga litoralis TaxID=3075598 RepID=A0ABU3BLY9_9BACT|nr:MULTISPECIES: trypsin-like peptidase domain-containing protein [unclassified Rubrivirga]MDT0630303.1 trypsin-like peptidase domain-containing protein [Rubrivirga sp. F394]MDT7855815.1 trypsin-like peptidase domain-containing protein [Rubrivirga sp. S365]